MKYFSQLAKRQAGQITMAGILGAAAISGALMYGFYQHKVEIELVDRLKATDAQLVGETDAMQKMSGYFDQEQARLVSKHEANAGLLTKLEAKSTWLSALPGSPTFEEMKQEEEGKYIASSARLAKERAAVSQVWSALVKPEQLVSLNDAQTEKLKASLTKDNLEVYASVRDCAARGAGEGAYCGASAAVGARLVATLDQVSALEAQSEAFARKQLASGWDDWDAAQNALTTQAFLDINNARDQAKAAFDRGDLDQEDWTSMQAGFDAAKSQAASQIAQDRQDLQSSTYSGHVSGHNWFLLSHWTNSAPSTYSSSHIVSHPYVSGGSAFVAPTPAMQSAAAQASAQGSKIASAAAQNMNARTALASIAMPKGTNPYSVNAGGSHLGSKVSMSFAKAAGPKVSMAMKSSGGKGGLSSKVSSYSASRAAARAGTMSVGHAGVGHSASGHSSGG